ncbi:hypothetical protein [Novosphingobium resinovorum]|uniref:Uncharacterized protein n=1 Tax=Novosphingobium resinovorum TaxID=158500 RepID=A0A1D8A343_9SPHN|nr:hypothetical protein [Novosphingobium resinovorum]AOR76537.1 hypothetical protein BES08_07105 [Novosphingobium resinovorum]
MNTPLPIFYSRIAWDAKDDQLVADVVAKKVAVDELFNRMPYRSFKAIRRRYVTHGRPDEETRLRRMMTFGSTALRRSLEAEYARRANNAER